MRPNSQPVRCYKDLYTIAHITLSIGFCRLKCTMTLLQSYDNAIQPCPVSNVHAVAHLSTSIPNTFFLFVLARLALQMEIMQSFALRINPGVCPSCPLCTKQNQNDDGYIHPSSTSDTLFCTSCRWQQMLVWVQEKEAKENATSLRTGMLFFITIALDKVLVVFSPVIQRKLVEIGVGILGGFRTGM